MGWKWTGSLVLCVGVAGCAAEKPKEAAKPAPAAKVTGGAKEDALATVKLEPEAEKRLGIELATVERRSVPRIRALWGDVMVPTGGTLPVSAPFTGTLLVAPERKLPLPGMHVKRGDPIFELEPLLSPDAQATLAAARANVKGQVDVAKERVTEATTRLERNQRLVKEKIVPPTAVVDAQQVLDQAKAAVKAAQDNLDELVQQETGKIKAVRIFSPSDGLLYKLHAQVDQRVAAGALLFEVVNLDTVWVRVPVYTGDIEAIDPDKDAGVSALSDLRGYDSKPAKPVVAPPTADPLAITADLYYEVENKNGKLRPGQRMGVMLPLRGEEQALVVPHSAVVLDIQGGEWVYENTAPHTFSRRRVEVDRVVGASAVLARGPKPGVKVVSVGVAELFGTEFAGLK